MNVSMNDVNKFIYIVYFFIVFFILFVAISCNNNLNFPPVNNVNHITNTKQYRSYSYQKPKSINIIVDASLSVKGFLSGRNNQYMETIRAITTNLSMELNFYKLANKTTLIKGDYENSLNQISTVEFYDGNWTNLTSIFETIKNPNTINLIITDGIQSTSNQFSENQLADFARKLNNFIKENGFFSIFGKYSAFNGKYYCEAKNQKLDLKNVERPFFGFVIGKREYFRFIQNKISGYWDKSFTIGQKLNKKIIIQHNLAGYNVFEKYNTSYLIKRNSQDSLNIRFQDNLSQNKKLDIVNSYEIEYDIFDISYSKDSLIVNNKIISNKASRFYTINKNEEIYIDLTKQSDMFGDFRAYRFSFLKNVPNWIKEWSTEFDCNYENAVKVYHFENWVKYILNNIENEDKEVFNYLVLIKEGS